MPLIYFEVYCANCGTGLCKLTTVNEKSGLNLEIEPCPNCLKEAENKGFQRGVHEAGKVIKRDIAAQRI